MLLHTGRSYLTLPMNQNILSGSLFPGHSVVASLVNKKREMDKGVIRQFSMALLRKKMAVCVTMGNRKKLAMIYYRKRSKSFKHKRTKLNTQLRYSNPHFRFLVSLYTSARV
jgi:hypothetical protein